MTPTPYKETQTMKLSGLAWTEADYREADQEVPLELLASPELTEGILMDADQIAEFVKDSIATLRILSDKKSDRYKELETAYHADLKYLQTIGQINEDDYNELTQSDNLHF
jgi:hypothetical protein